MPDPDPMALLPAELASALTKRGYATLTPVQAAVLDPALADRDLRISSQTGSGKTLAIGFTVRGAVGPSARSTDGVGRPRAVVVTPTRELATQVQAELAWLYAPSKAQVASVTGGSSVRDERRTLAHNPAIVVGTPGRLLDHLRRGSVELTQTSAIVLDEADRMLDLGFREDLEAILELAPEGHRTHLVSATFPREVEALARRVQTDPAQVQGTPLGSANADIDHVVHVVKQSERVAALINLLLAAPNEQVLVFSRTRADVAEVCDELDQAGFAVGSLSGEMEQDARHRALSAFKRGKMRVLIATDVAARGIDHQDIARVVQLEPPTDADTYTHRSGRTGRAGRKGKSSIMVTPAGVARVTALLKRAGVRYRFEPVPSAQQITAAQDAELLRELTADPTPPDAETAPADPRALRLAAELVASGNAERALARLLERSSGAAICAPREITPIQPSAERDARGKQKGPRAGKAERFAESRPRRERHEPERREPERREPERREPERREPERREPERGQRVARRMPQRASEPAGEQDWVRFHVSWGREQGADPRRLLAMLCRRAGVKSSEIGAIRLTATASFVDVSARAASGFESKVRRPDPRDPGVLIQRDAGRPPARAGHGAPRERFVSRRDQR